MDTTMIGALLKAYGAPNTPENINALTQRYASDPTAAERKINGLQGQSDESGGSRDAILNMMIDKTIEQAAPQGNVTVGAPVMESVANSSVPTRRSATAGRAPVDPRQLSNSPPSSGDPLANEVNRNTPSNPSGGVPNGGVADSSWMLDLLAPILGILGAGGVASAAMRGRNATPAKEAAPSNGFTQDPRAATYSTTPESEGRPASPVDYRSNPKQKRITDQSTPANAAPPPVKEEEWAPTSIKEQMAKKKQQGWKPELAKRAFGRK